MDFQTLVNELRQRKTIPALSIQQPWAWFIVNGYKDVENRTWSTKFRGPVLIHAGKKMDRAYDPKGPLGYIPLIDLFASAIPGSRPLPPKDLPRGGIVGLVDLSMLEICFNAIEHSKTLVKNWLRDYMFAGKENAEGLASEIAAKLADYKEFFSHGRPIGIQQAQQLELGLQLEE